MGMISAGWVATPSRGSAWAACTCWAIHASLKVTLMKPGPLTSADAMRSPVSRCSTIASSTG